jgi:HPt (histidine-containing phosphotransfer) domain-containing protein
MSASEPPGSVPPVDMDWLRECADDDVDAMKEMVGLYVNRTTGLIAELRLAVETKNAAEIRRIAHACAGSSGACGVSVLVPTFKELERMGVDGKLDNAAASLALVERDFVRVTEFLAAQKLI